MLPINSGYWLLAVEPTTHHPTARAETMTKIKKGPQQTINTFHFVPTDLPEKIKIAARPSLRVTLLATLRIRP